MLLDTTIVIDLLGGKSKAVSWYAGLKRQRVAITPIVWLETMQGARNNSERAQIIRFLKRFYLEHPTRDDNWWAMRQFARYRLSHGVAWADILIASVAVRLSVPIYTLNIKHFAPLPGVAAQRPY